MAETRNSDRFSETVGAIKLSGRYRFPAAGALTKDYPLIVALHGGTYTSAYFDLPRFSLIDRAVVLGMPIIALDRPGYGDTTPFRARSGRPSPTTRISSMPPSAATSGSVMAARRAASS